MNPCQNCGKLNTAETNFCRFCGTKFVISPERFAPDPYNYNAPQPYSWKTDEFQTQSEARKTGSQLKQHVDAQPTRPIQPIHNFHAPAPLAAPMNANGNYAIDPNYRCPRCGTSYLPVIDRRISSAGWVVFSLLLVFTIIFFWVGLLMKEDVAICPVCRNRVG